MKTYRDLHTRDRCILTFLNQFSSKSSLSFPTVPDLASAARDPSQKNHIRRPSAYCSDTQAQFGSSQRQLRSDSGGISSKDRICLTQTTAAAAAETPRLSLRKKHPAAFLSTYASGQGLYRGPSTASLVSQDCSEPC